MSRDSVPVSTLKYIRNFADAIIKASKAPITNAPKHEIVWAMVDSVQVGPPKTLTIFLSGSSTSTAGVSYASSYVPEVGDYVMCSKFGTDLVVMFGMGGAVSGGVHIPLSYAVLGPLANLTLPGPFIPVPAGQSVKVVACVGEISSGSVTVEVRDNGATITGLGACSVTTSPTTFSLTAHPVANNHRLDIILSSISGTGDLSFTIYIAISG
jgi:hypothetical protein